MNQTINAAGVEVSGKMICSMLNAIPDYQPTLDNLLIQNNLKNPNPENWYSMKDYLEIFSEISKSFGPNLLFTIGKSIPNNSDIDDASSLENALRNLDSFYQKNHRGENIGYYKLISFSKERKEAKIECKNPYPCYVDRGILTSVAKHFKPKDAQMIYVELDFNRPNRLAGAEVSYYTIFWN